MDFFPRNSWKFLQEIPENFSKKFLRISPRNSWEFLRTCHQLYGLFGELNKKHWLKKFLRVSQEFFFGNSWDFLRNIYEKISGLDHQLSDFVRNWKKTLSFKKFNNFPKDFTVKEFNEFSRIFRKIVTWILSPGRKHHHRSATGDPVPPEGPTAALPYRSSRHFQWRPQIKYSETLNKEYIGRIYQMSSWQFFNEFYTILRKFQYLRK